MRGGGFTTYFEMRSKARYFFGFSLGRSAAHRPANIGSRHDAALANGMPEFRRRRRKEGVLMPLLLFLRAARLPNYFVDAFAAIFRGALMLAHCH